MRNIYLRIQCLLQDEDGVTSIEYALIASMIALVIIGAVTNLGDVVCERFRAVATALGGTPDAC